MTLRNKTIFITGASRGIGREIALTCAKHGANIAIIAKTAEPHPSLPGTIHSVAQEVEEAGGRALAIACDVRDETAIHAAVQQVAKHFGGIDIVVNNASAIQLTPTLETSLKRFDLMMSVNVRATFAVSQACIPWLKRAANPHVLTLSPPLDIQAKWFAPHFAYTYSKFGMSLCTLGMAEEFKMDGIAFNSLWPKTVIATSAIVVNFPKHVLQGARDPSIVARAAEKIFLLDAKICTGNFFIDEEVLSQHGITNFDEYAVDSTAMLYPDLFLPD